MTIESGNAVKGTGLAGDIAGARKKALPNGYDVSKDTEVDPVAAVLAEYFNVVEESASEIDIEAEAIAIGDGEGSVRGDVDSLRYTGKVFYVRAEDGDVTAALRVEAGDDGFLKIYVDRVDFNDAATSKIKNFDFGEQPYEASFVNGAISVDFDNAPYQTVDVDDDATVFSLAIPKGLTRGSLVIRNTDTSSHTIAGPSGNVTFFGGESPGFILIAGEVVHMTFVYMGSVHGWHVTVCRPTI